MGRKSSELRKDGVPLLVEWMAQQHNNSDPVRAAAARYIGDRWPFSNGYNHARVLKLLGSENSEYLHGARLLTEDYAETFGLEADEQFEHVGVIGPLVPVAREQCTHHYKSGKLCDRDAVPGSGACGYHGGSWMNESERAEMVQRVSERLVDISDRAVGVLADLMDNARSEKVRHDAAVAILDRVGVGPVSKVELEITPAAEEAAAEIRGRLLKLAARNGDIVPGEIVEHPMGPKMSDCTSPLGAVCQDPACPLHFGEAGTGA